MDRLMLSRSQGLVYCLLDQQNNRQGSSPLCSPSLFCLRHYRRLPCPPFSLSTFKPTFLVILTSPSLPFTLCLCPLVPPPIRPFSPLQPWTISGATCPGCCSRPIILQYCLPSGHLAPHHSRGDFGADSCPWRSENRPRDKVGDGMGCKEWGEEGVAWLSQSAPALGDSWTPSNLLAYGGQPCYHSHKDQILGLEHD